MRRVWDPEGKEYIDMLSAYSYVVHLLAIAANTNELLLQSC